jgi:hypothetical protein
MSAYLVMLYFLGSTCKAELLSLEHSPYECGKTEGYACTLYSLHLLTWRRTLAKWTNRSCHQGQAKPELVREKPLTLIMDLIWIHMMNDFIKTFQ